MRSLVGLVCAAVALALAAPCAARAAVATDPTAMGPLAVAHSEYRLKARIDPQVTSDVVTELWARIYRPKPLGGAPHPLIVMLHGNHGTCGHHVAGIKGRVDDDITYTFTGKCPDGYIVTPNHTGYAYVAEQLASWGYVVVSINANRGVTAADGVPGDWGLNLRRGRLILRHLEQLDRWNTSGGAPATLGFDMKHVLDFSQVGLMGHSRGGEGAIAAFTLFNDAGSPWPARFHTRPQIRAIFELAPVDGQTERTFSADNVAWNVLLPLCDGDVSDLEGVRVFDRTIEALAETAPRKKSVYAVWGANHNFYNSQWQQTDSGGCDGAGNRPLFDLKAAGSPEQRLTGLYGMAAFFRSHVGKSADPTLGELLDVSYELPAPLAASTILERSFSESAATAQNAVVEAFTGPAGQNSHGAANDLSNISMGHGSVPDHDFTLSAGQIAWTTPGEDVFFQSNWTRAGAGHPVGKHQTLEFRVARQNMAGNPADAPVGADFSIALVAADGSMSSARPLSAYANLYAPVGSFWSHPILETVRIPLADFGVAADSQVRGVRFTFDRTGNEEVYLSDIRFSRPAPAGPGEPPQAGAHAPAAARAPRTVPGLPVVDKGRVVAVRPARPDGMVEIELESREALPIRDALPVLRIAGKAFRLSRFPNQGATFTIAFRLTAAEYAALPPGAAAIVEYGRDRWSFGPLPTVRP